ncbi:MAG: hypothetical protein D4R94_04380 [Chitinophagaceae bacterium]|nr:MAG: hypothetical protein D4R94_04380 [Chitinophagaceae bacterium]
MEKYEFFGTEYLLQTLVQTVENQSKSLQVGRVFQVGVPSESDGNVLHIADLWSISFYLLT